MIRIYNNNNVEKIRIDSTGNVGIGTMSPSSVTNSFSEWEDILRLSETNLAVKIALDKLRTTYHLSKDYDSKT